MFILSTLIISIFASAQIANAQSKLLEGVKSILVVGLNYFTVPKKESPNRLLIGRYAWGNDYHKVIEKRLNELGRWLEKERPGSQWKVCVDSKTML